MNLGKYENFASNVEEKTLVPCKLLVMCDPLDKNGESVLRKMLGVAGVDELECYVMDIYNEERISVINPKLIIVMGKNIKNTLGLEDKYDFHDVVFDMHQYKCVVIDHPSYLVKYPSGKDGSPKRRTFEILQEVKLKLGD